MAKRNRLRSIATNNEDMYKKVFDKKGVKSIIQYATPVHKRPTDERLENVRYQSYVWSAGDRFWRLADRFYGDKNYWYLIARFNNKPTEAHIETGETIKIPLNVAEAVQVLG
tara:strand:- start:52 stop:387 length:336 start_codon:yes stop_codon:yes gene_type:complete